ncbi:hypothetical protein C5167_032462 [Papaver somniferum]|uniref:Uncharacterized protein n=1 Tax=Papaver somniferum TaxID=3469 RepID=A0A4Y7KAH7_PAPSO|nr:hypothetical protein C5167_032462 [Papaver somniferum]
MYLQIGTPVSCRIWLNEESIKSSSKILLLLNRLMSLSHLIKIKLGLLLRYQNSGLVSLSSGSFLMTVSTNSIIIGLHVAVIMFTGYLVGYAAFRALFNHNPVMNAAGGILGLVFAMLLETLLFIIKSSSKRPVSSSLASSSASKLKKDQ